MVSQDAIKAVFERALKLKAGESCLIVTDTVKENIGRLFYEYARLITPKSRIIVMQPTQEHGAEPPPDVASTMLEYDVQLLITHRSLTHTSARIQACAKGARIASMPTITEDIANRCLDIDYEALKQESNRIYEILNQAKTVRITTDLGTDVTMTIGSSKILGKTGGMLDKPGVVGNLPEGEVHFSPATCDGTFVVDASFPDLGLLSSPLTFKAKDGMVYEITGERAEEVIQRLDRVGPGAYKVAELGIGLNPKARIIGIVLEDEKVLGTVHIALGNNCSYGGDNDVPLHLDGVITKPDIYVDSKKLVEKGRFI